MPFKDEACMVTPHTRRVFLTYGAQSLVAMPTLLSAPWLLADEGPDLAQDVTFKHLQPEYNKVLVILLPMALGVELNPAEPKDQRILTLTLQGLDQLIDKLSERNREDLLLLLNLLSMPLTRILLGLWTKWEKASRDEVEGFLSEWERSAISLKRFGYQSLVQLMEFAYYGVPENTATIRYPDVPAAIQPFLRRFSAGEH
jgi:hypothetical protein